MHILPSVIGCPQEQLSCLSFCRVKQTSHSTYPFSDGKHLFANQMQNTPGTRLAQILLPFCLVRTCIPFRTKLGLIHAHSIMATASPCRVATLSNARKVGGLLYIIWVVSNETSTQGHECKLGRDFRSAVLIFLTSVGQAHGSCMTRR